MAGEGAPHAIGLNPEALPSIAFTASREVEASVRCADDEERNVFEARFGSLSVSEPERFHYADTRIWIKDLEGVVRVRVITQPHRDPPPPPVYEWAVKIFMPRDNMRFAKAPIEYQGVAQSEREVHHALEHVLRAMEVSFEPIGSDTLIQERTVYRMENGVSADINVCVSKNGAVLTPPHISAEFECALPIDASERDIADAEDRIQEAAARAGIPAERLSSSRGLSNRQSVQAA